MAKDKEPLYGAQKTIDMAILHHHYDKDRAKQEVKDLQKRGFNWFKFVGGKIVGVN